MKKIAFIATILLSSIATTQSFATDADFYLKCDDVAPDGDVTQIVVYEDDFALSSKHKVDSTMHINSSNDYVGFVFIQRFASVFHLCTLKEKRRNFELTCTMPNGRANVFADCSKVRESSIDKRLVLKAKKIFEN